MLTPTAEKKSFLGRSSTTVVDVCEVPVVEFSCLRTRNLEELLSTLRIRTFSLPTLKISFSLIFKPPITEK